MFIPSYPIYTVIVLGNLDNPILVFGKRNTTYKQEVAH
jgi:hypothetical protein